MISIIIPAYNSAATIVEALESVLAQTLWGASAERGAPSAEGKRGERSTAEGLGGVNSELGALGSTLPALYEVIIVDDCSMDNTVEIVQHWIRENQLLSESPASPGQLSSCSVDKLLSESPKISPSSATQQPNNLATNPRASGTTQQLNNSTTNNWRILRLPINSGPAAARNAGIAAAHGDWIAFLDADDLWLPWHCEVLLGMAGLYATILVCGDSIRFSDGGGNRPPIEKPLIKTESRDVPLTELVCHNPVATSAAMVRRDVLLEVGGFDPQFRGPEDYDLWLRLAARGGVRVTTAPVSRYRYVEGSLSMDDRKFLPQVLRVLDKAFAPGGALNAYVSHKTAAISNQLWNASWMAYQRGARWDAIGLWWKAWRLNNQSKKPVERQWYRLLARYIGSRK